MEPPIEAPSSLLNAPFEGPESSCCNQSERTFFNFPAVPLLGGKRRANGAIIGATNASSAGTPGASTSNNGWKHKNKPEDMMDDAALAREMNALSAEEREQVLDDIHGVSKLQEETQEFWRKRLQELDDALEATPMKRKKAYNKALFLRPGLKKMDTKFKRMFLRAQVYHPVKAAERLIKYFDLKLALFGEDKLVKKITMQDLSSDDLWWIQSGFHIVLPFRDPSGRPILFIDLTKLDLKKNPTISFDGKHRSWWYMIMKGLEDDETAQKVGICVIGYNRGGDLLHPDVIGKTSEMMRTTGSVVRTIPCRVTNVLLCYNDPKMEWFVGMLRIALGKFIRLRLRVHFGSDIEHDYFVMSFGIPGATRLIQNASLGKTELHKEYVQRQREMDKRYEQEAEHHAATMRLIPYPKPDDVLIGRGVPFHEFSGSQRLDELLFQNLERYLDCKEDKFLKTCITMEVVNTIRSYGGRFLVRSPDNEDQWEILDDISAREKVASAFRTRVRAKKKTKMASRQTSIHGEGSGGPSMAALMTGNAAKRFRADPSL